MSQYLRVGQRGGQSGKERRLLFHANTIGAAEIGGYYLAIQILWGFMLVPVSAKALVAMLPTTFPG